MMDTYLMMLYVSVEQEKAVKQYFLDNGWPYCKPDLSVLTDCIGPIVAEMPTSNKGVTNKRKKSTPAKTPAKKTKTTEKPTPAKPVRTPIQHSHGTRSRKVVMVAQPTVELTEVKVEKLDGEFVDNNVEDEEEENMDGPEAQNLDDLEPVTDNEKSASTSVAVSKLEDKSKKNASVASTAIKDMDKEDDDDIDDGDVEKVDDTDGSQTVAPYYGKKVRLQYDSKPSENLQQ